MGLEKIIQPQQSSMKQMNEMIVYADDITQIVQKKGSEKF